MKLWMVGCVGLLTACGSSGTTHEEASVDVTQLLEVATVVEHAVAEDSGVPLEAEPAGHAEELAVVVEEQPVEPATTKERHVYRLRHGETLHHFAKWSDRTVEDVVESSGIELREDYDAGTEIALCLETLEKSRLDERREAHRVERASRYIEQRGGESTTAFHTVTSGESAWKIARQTIGIPVWLLESYNPSVDLDRLRPGQVLMFPQITEDNPVPSGEGLLALQ